MCSGSLSSKQKELEAHGRNGSHEVSQEWVLIISVIVKHEARFQNAQNICIYTLILSFLFRVVNKLSQDSKVSPLNDDDHQQQSDSIQQVFLSSLHLVEGLQ
jgi:hypothetical protein